VKLSDTDNKRCPRCGGEMEFKEAAECPTTGAPMHIFQCQDCDRIHTVQR